MADARLRLRATARFLASIYDGLGTKVRADGLARYIDLDYTKLEEVTSDIDPDNSIVAIYNKQTGIWNTSSLSSALVAGSEIVDQLQAAIDATAAAQEAAEAARDESVAAASTGFITLQTRTAMAATTFPGTIAAVTTLGRSAVGDYGNLTYRRVDADPGHAASVRSVDRLLSDGVTTSSSNGGWWAAVPGSVIAPEACGDIGVNVATDTATLQAWANAWKIGGYSLKLNPRQYLPTGSIIFDTGNGVLNLKCGGASIRQQSTAGGGIGWATFLFKNIPQIDIDGESATFYGYADKVIAAGKSPVMSTYMPGGEGGTNTNYLTAAPGWITLHSYSVGDEVRGPSTPTDLSGILYECLIAHTSGSFASDLAAGKFAISGREYRGASSSHNGVSAMEFQTCGATHLKIKNLKTRNHAGGSIYGYDCLHVYVDNCDIKGIGSPYIQPGDNGADVGITFFASSIFDYVYDQTITRCRIRDHAFGRQAAISRVTAIGNVIGPIPGQHGAYQIDCWQQNISETYKDCHYIAFKEQHENYAGTYFGTLWVTGHAYAVGDEARNSSVLYQCISAHTSGTFATDLSGGNWIVSPKARRAGGRISVSADNCSSIVQIIRAAPADNTDCALEGLEIVGCTGRNLTSDAMVLDNIVDGMISKNVVLGASRYGIYARSFSGVIDGNRIKNTASSGIQARFSGETFITNNRMRNVGLTGATDQDKTPIFVGNAISTDLKTRDANPELFILGNHIKTTTGDFASTYASYADTNYVCEVINNTANTSKNFRCDGTLTAYRNFGNTFGFVAGAQALPLFTFADGTDLLTITPSTATATQDANMIRALLGYLAKYNFFGRSP